MGQNAIQWPATISLNSIYIMFVDGDSITQWTRQQRRRITAGHECVLGHVIIRSWEIRSAKVRGKCFILSRKSNIRTCT